jgi:hypothetical protein
MDGHWIVMGLWNILFNTRNNFTLSNPLNDNKFRINYIVSRLLMYHDRKKNEKN